MIRKKSNLFNTAKLIPGWLTYYEIVSLYENLKKYNKKDTIGVEIGSMHGKSSYVISETIKKGKLYCIDKWNNSSTYNKEINDDIIIEQGFPSKNCYNTLNFFKENIKTQTNIITIQGYSPYTMSSWNILVDFVFLDAAHRNPNDKENIDFWLPKIKKNGCFIGHDYSDAFPDVITNVHYMEKLLDQKVQLFNGTNLWKFDL